MLAELEAAVADSVNDAGRRSHAPSPGATCANCEAVLQGPFCHDCGQSGDRHKRSILHLTWELIEDLFHLDGRLRHTAPDLFFRPGRLARDYIEGRLARHVPPFRTFLVSLLLFILAAEHATHEGVLANARQAAAHKAMLATPQGRAADAARRRQEAASEHDDALREAVQDRAGDLKEADADRGAIEDAYRKAAAKADAQYAAALAKADQVAQGRVPPPVAEAPASPDAAVHHKRPWQDNLKKAIDNPEYFLSVVFGWGHRMAVLLLPIVGLSLALVYRNKPQFFIHDHMMVAMDLLSFGFLTNALGLILPFRLMVPWLGLVALWTPVNLFQTLRGAYGSSILGAALKTLIVWATSVTAFAVLIVSLMIFALGQL